MAIALPEIEVTPPSDDNSVKMADSSIGSFDVDDLINHFSGKKDTPNNLDVDSLVKHFSQDNIPATPPTMQQPLQQPQEVHPPISGLSPQQSDNANAQLEQAETYNKANPETVGSQAVAATELPVINFWKNTKDNFNSGYDLYAQGFKDLTNNKPASGIGNAALGAAAMATSPLSGAADTFIRDPITQLTGNPDIGNRAAMVATGGLPIVGASSLIRSALPTNRAMSALVSRIGPENIPAALARMKGDPNLSLADVSPSVRQMTQKLVTTEGEPQNQITNWVNDRAQAAKGNVEGIYNNTMGVPVNVLSKLRDLKQSAKDVGTKYIQPALDKTNPVDVSGVVSDIDNTLKPGVNSVISVGKPLPSTELNQQLSNVRSLLTDDKSVRTDPKQLHVIQSNLRARADDLLNSASGQDRQLGYSLMDIRNQIVDAIDRASPQVTDQYGITSGTYKSGLSKYRDEKQIEDAFIKGAQITRNRPGQWDDRPEFWEDWTNKASPQEIEAAKEGSRLAVDQQINGMKFGARKGTDIPDVEFNKEKLGLLFGHNEVNSMSKMLQNQKDIADTNSKLIQNSQTAMRTKADSEVDLPKPSPLSLPTYLAPIVEAGASYMTGTPGLGLASIIGAKTLNMAKNKIAMSAQLSKNKALSNLITSSGSDRDDLINALSKYIPQAKPSMLQRIRNRGLPILPP